MLKTADLDYDLPEELIATRPAEPRDSARLLVVSRSEPGRIEDRAVRDLPGLLAPSDLLVFNTTSVLPARLEGVREGTGGRVEGLFLRELPPDRSDVPPRWVVMLRAGHLKPGAAIRLSRSESSGPSELSIVLVDREPSEPGAWVVEPHRDPGSMGSESPASVPSLLATVGRTPLPPYILRARRAAAIAVRELEDRDRYQTVYADPSQARSVAAPTAGLHFTPELLRRLEGAGIRRADVVLHVGTGTFKPVETETVEAHAMHAEWCELPRAARTAIARTRANGGRVIAVGTTSARTLEAAAARPGDRADGDGRDAFETRLLITPGHTWSWTDGILTNFHLPRSTLLALVAAMFPGGIARVREIYAHAVRERYRFYSYGDAMLILP